MLTQMNKTNIKLLNKNKTFECKLTNYSIACMSMYCLIITTGIIGNSLVLYIFRPCKKRVRKSYEILIWYLSLFDLTSCLIAIHEVYETVTCYENWPFGWFGCKTLYSCYYISINISICILLIIALDRYRCIVTPFKRKLTANFIHLAVFASIFISFIIQWYQFNALHIQKHKEKESRHCVQNRKLLLYTTPRVATILFRDIVFIFVFTVTTITVHLSFENRRKRSFINQSKTKITNRRIFNMLLIMGGTFVVLVLPYDIWDCAMLISRILPPSYMIVMSNSLQHLDKILSMLQMCNSVVNCFIYAKMHRYFKATLRNSVRKERRDHLLQVPMLALRLSNTMETQDSMVGLRSRRSSNMIERQGSKNDQ